VVTGSPPQVAMRREPHAMTLMLKASSWSLRDLR